MTDTNQLHQSLPFLRSANCSAVRFNMRIHISARCACASLLGCARDRQKKLIGYGERSVQSHCAEPPWLGCLRYQTKIHLSRFNIDAKPTRKCLHGDLAHVCILYFNIIDLPGNSLIQTRIDQMQL